MLRKHRWLLRAHATQRFLLLYGPYALSIMAIFATYNFNKTTFLSTRPNVLDVIEALQQNAFWFIVGFTVLVFVLGIVNLSNVNKSWRLIKTVLDQYQRKCIPIVGPQDQHRITLFKIERRVLPPKRNKNHTFLKRVISLDWFCRYLVPVIRSGHLAQSSKAKFKIHDSGNRCEGIAGEAYTINNRVSQTELPNLCPDSVKKLGKEELAEAIKEYAKKTKCSEDYVDRYIHEAKTLPRSIAATPVEVKGEIWGVLVIDSTHPTVANADAIIDYTVVIGIVGKLLERRL